MRRILFSLAFSLLCDSFVTEKLISFFCRIEFTQTMKKDEVLNMEKKTLSDHELKQVAGGVGSGSVVSSGSFASNTGTQLNVLVNWSVMSDAYGQKTLNVDVCSTSYSLYCSGGGVELSVNGMVYTANGPAINYGGNTMVTNRLASFSIPNVSGAVSLSAVWHFNGSYSGVPIGDIRASGIANA